jgi:hypothetical protein
LDDGLGGSPAREVDDHSDRLATFTLDDRARFGRPIVDPIHQHHLGALKREQHRHRLTGAPPWTARSHTGIDHDLSVEFGPTVHLEPPRLPVIQQWLFGDGVHVAVQFLFRSMVSC